MASIINVDQIGHSSSGNTALTVDTSGNVSASSHILTPARPAFMVYKTVTSGQTGVNDHISFNNTEFDIGSNWNTNYFLAPVAGVYHFALNCLSSNSDGLRFPQGMSAIAYIEKSTDNGSNWTRIYEGHARVQTSESRTNMAVSGLIKLAVNDRVRCFVGSGWIYIATDRERCTFSGYLVG